MKESQLPLIRIGSRLRTNRGETITVESISTKRQHRKVGYHAPDDPYHIRYVRLCQCEPVETPITAELLEANGWTVLYFPHPEDNSKDPDYAKASIGPHFAEYQFGRNSLNIWLDYDCQYCDIINPDLHIRVCKNAEQLQQAFAILGIDYQLK